MASEPVYNALGGAGLQACYAGVPAGVLPAPSSQKRPVKGMPETSRDYYYVIGVEGGADATERLLDQATRSLNPPAGD